MKLKSLLSLLEQARSVLGHTEYVVIGSLSILALEEFTQIPPEMSMSIDVDAYTRKDPDRIFDLMPLLGEDSAFHRDHGIFLDAVSPHVATLPEGWEARMLKVEHDGLLVWFLDPNDAAVSKLARLQENDVRWVLEGVRAGLVSVPMVRARFKTASFLDAAEAQRAQEGLNHIILALGSTS